MAIAGNETHYFLGEKLKYKQTYYNIYYYTSFSTVPLMILICNHNLSSINCLLYVCTYMCVCVFYMLLPLGR